MVNKLIPTALNHSPMHLSLLALAPLLVMSADAASAVVLAILSVVIIALSAAALSKLLITLPAPLPFLLCIIVPGTVVSITALLFEAYWPNAHHALLWQWPVLATHSFLLLPYLQGNVSFKSQCGKGLLFAGLLIVFALLRELLATGSLFMNAASFSIDGFTFTPIHFWQGGLSLVQLSGGGFIVLGLLLALYKTLVTEKTAAPSKLIDTAARRARVTGRIA